MHQKNTKHRHKQRHYRAFEKKSIKKKKQKKGYKQKLVAIRRTCLFQKYQISNHTSYTYEDNKIFLQLYTNTTSINKSTPHWNHSKLKPYRSHQLNKRKHHDHKYNRK